MKFNDNQHIFDIHVQQTFISILENSSTRCCLKVTQTVGELMPKQKRYQKRIYNIPAAETVAPLDTAEQLQTRGPTERKKDWFTMWHRDKRRCRRHYSQPSVTFRQIFCFTWFFGQWFVCCLQHKKQQQLLKFLSFSTFILASQNTRFCEARNAKRLKTDWWTLISLVYNIFNLKQWDMPTTNLWSLNEFCNISNYLGKTYL